MRDDWPGGGERAKDVHNAVAGVLKVQSFPPICPVVHLSKLFAILIAAALLLAPFAMQSASAMAPMPSSHHGETISQDHCDGEPATETEGEMADGSCCAAMCSAVAISARQSAADEIFAQLPATSLATSHYRGILDEIATPPPRRA